MKGRGSYLRPVHIPRADTVKIAIAVSTLRASIPIVSPDLLTSNIGSGRIRGAPLGGRPAVHASRCQVVLMDATGQTVSVSRWADEHSSSSNDPSRGYKDLESASGGRDYLQSPSQHSSSWRLG